MTDLFETTPPEPLAARMRPRTLDEYVGQEHILGAGKALRTALEEGMPHSMVLWGPPGVGKTTLAKLLARPGRWRLHVRLGSRPILAVPLEVLSASARAGRPTHRARYARS